MTTNDDELWYVQLDSGELRELTLDELDAAFNAGTLHENTYVMEVNGTEWQTLADVAGLNDEEEPAAPPAPAYAPYPVGHARPLPQQPVRSGQSQWPPSTSAAMAASAWPPVVSATGYAPRGAVPYSAGAQSTAPVVHDLSDLDLNPPFKRRGMGKWVAAAAVLVLGGAGFAATQLKVMPKFAFTAPKAPPGVAAAMTLPRSTPEPTPAATTPPAPTPPAATPPKEEKAEEKKEATSRSLSEEMKEKLLDADKSRAQGRKSKRAARASKAGRRGGGKKGGDGSSPFRGGGSAADPLNSKL